MYLFIEWKSMVTVVFIRMTNFFKQTQTTLCDGGMVVCYIVVVCVCIHSHFASLCFHLACFAIACLRTRACASASMHE